jgi:hypothetical protein
MTYTRYIIALIWALISIFSVMAQEETEELPVIPYFQSYDFNVPILEGWENQSTEEIAQFYLADAQATIRTHVVNNSDSIAGAAQDLQDFFDSELPDPIYSEKVNLADGTWAVLVYQIDENTTASAMSRQSDGRSFVVSFIERNPDVELIMATIAHADEAQETAVDEIAIAVETFTSETANNLSDPEIMKLSSGEWVMQSAGDVSAMGWVFGNDSYLAVANAEIDNLPELANAYNTTLLGFFVTPNNGAYLALGIAVSLGTLAILLFSIIWRARSLRKDLAVIQQLSEEDD